MSEVGLLIYLHFSRSWPNDLNYETGSSLCYIERKISSLAHSFLELAVMGASPAFNLDGIGLAYLPTEVS